MAPCIPMGRVGGGRGSTIRVKYFSQEHNKMTQPDLEPRKSRAPTVKRPRFLQVCSLLRPILILKDLIDHRK